MKVQSIKKGFTLIELLVVITIIGILATGGVSVFTTQLQGARDSTRISDMKLLETGIHQYFNDQGTYPDEADFKSSVSGYLSKELSDPRADEGICWSTDGSDNSNDVDCGGYYNRANDGFGLTDSAFKLGISFEKETNMENRASGDGWTWSTTNPGNAFYFETFAGAGAEYIGVWTWTTAGSIALVDEASHNGVETDMVGSAVQAKVY